MKKILFLVNPVSGGGLGKKIAGRIKEYVSVRLAEDKYDIVFTSMDMDTQVVELAGGYEILAGVGGDGTACRIMQNILNLENRPKAGLIPLGTGNDLARTLGLSGVLKSRGLDGLIDVLLAGKCTRLDLLNLNDSVIFSNYFGIGTDAKITKSFNALRPGFSFGSLFIGRVINLTFYAVIGLLNLRYSIPFDVRLHYRTASGAMALVTASKGAYGIIVSNISSYAGGSFISSAADMGDGRFEVTVIENRIQALRLIATRISQKSLDQVYKGLIQFQTDSLGIELPGDVFCQLDGEDATGIVRGKQDLTVTFSSSLDVIIP